MALEQRCAKQDNTKRFPSGDVRLPTSWVGCTSLGRGSAPHGLQLWHCCGLGCVCNACGHGGCSPGVSHLILGVSLLTHPGGMGLTVLLCAAGQRALGTAGSPAGEAAVTPTGSTERRGNDAEEEEEEEEEEDEEDTEEDEVQVIEVPKGSGAVPQQQEGGMELFPPSSPTCNTPAERAGEQPGLGKKNDISRHSYSRYNTISYRKIRKGNTKQRIDEFESMMHL